MSAFVCQEAPSAAIEFECGPASLPCGRRLVDLISSGRSKRYVCLRCISAGLAQCCRFIPLCFMCHWPRGVPADVVLRAAVQLLPGRVRSLDTSTHTPEGRPFAVRLDHEIG